MSCSNSTTIAKALGVPKSRVRVVRGESSRHKQLEIDAQGRAFFTMTRLRGQTLGELRFGLTVAIVLGGVISMAVLVVGTAVNPPLAFDALGALTVLPLALRTSRRSPDQGSLLPRGNMLGGCLLAGVFLFPLLFYILSRRDRNRE